MRRAPALFITIFILSSVIGYSQRVSYSGKQVQLKEIFSAIKSQTGYVFFYDAALLRKAKPVTVDLKNVSIEEALEQTFKDQPFGWVIENKTITIIKKQIQVNQNVQEPKISPTIRVTGTVKNEEDKPIPGASVIVKGTSRGTSTNVNGVFTIDVNKGSVLIFSSVSYLEKQIVADEKTIAIQLELDFKPMEKFIVGGNIMPIKRKAEVSSVAVIDSKTLESLPYQNIEQIFRGLVAGVNNIQPGYETSQHNYSSGEVSLRGAAGFSGYGLVKVYVDGIEYAGGSYFINTLDKNNIDHIEVVKGASASALYGSGSNGGVILVYTKKGNINTTNIDLTVSTGWYDSKWQTKKPFRQIYSFNITRGFNHISYFIGGNINNNETYNPGGKQKRYFFSGGVTYTGNKLKIIIRGQHYENNYDVERNPFWDTSSKAYFNRPGLKLPDTAQGIVKSNMLGANINFYAKKWWTHNLMIGWNDNNLNKESFVQNARPFRSERKIKGPSLRYYNTIALANQSGFKTSLLTGFEYSNILSKLLTVNRTTTGFSFLKDTVDLQKNTGVFAQLNPSYKNKIFLTLSGRYEFNKNFGTMFNPRVGLTTNFLVGELILKPRIAWGRGITPPSWRDKNPPPGTSQSQIFVPNPDLKPQQQAGWDYGLEGYLGDNLRFEVSRYDYILNDGIYTASSAGRLQVLNGGKIANDGWEFSASYKLKNFRISGTYSIMDAILKEPVSGKVTKNDLTLPGEQMLFIPRDVAGFIIGYNFPKIFSHSDKLSASISMTYTSGAPTIDYVKYTYDFFINNNFSNFINYGFRYYKTQLLSVTRFNLNVEYDLYKDLRFFMQLSNIGDNTNPEYDNTFPSIGRGWMFGLKYNFSKTAGTDQ